MAKKCYCCDSDATTVEHVPPKCLFPAQKDLPSGEDLRKSLITVPACIEHNLGKSDDDEHLMYVLAMTYQAGSTGGRHFSSKIYRAIQRRPGMASKLMSRTSPVTLHNPHSGHSVETLAVDGDSERVGATLKYIALGLYRHHVGNNWRGPLRVVPEFMRYVSGEDAAKQNASLEDGTARANALFAKELTYGANPSIFVYQFIDPGVGGPAVMRMRFYGGCNVITFFGSFAEG